MSQQAACPSCQEHCVAAHRRSHDSQLQYTELDRSPGPVIGSGPRRAAPHLAAQRKPRVLRRVVPRDLRQRDVPPQRPAPQACPPAQQPEQRRAAKHAPGCAAFAPRSKTESQGEVPGRQDEQGRQTGSLSSRRVPARSGCVRVSRSQSIWLYPFSSGTLPGRAGCFVRACGSPRVTHASCSAWPAVHARRAGQGRPDTKTNLRQRGSVDGRSRQQGVLHAGDRALVTAAARTLLGSSTRFEHGRTASCEHLSNRSAPGIRGRLPAALAPQK